MPRVGLTPQELITLDGITFETPVWTIPAPPPKPTRSFKVGDSVLTAQRWKDVQVEIFTDASLTGSPWQTLTFGQVDEDTYSANIELAVDGLIGHDGYLIKTNLTDPDSESKARKDAYFQIREVNLNEND